MDYGRFQFVEETDHTEKGETMGVRERLIELLKTDACPTPFMCDPTCRYYGYRDCFPDRFADHLIANGVTVQECGNWKYYHKQNKAVCTSCGFERDLDTNFGKAIACPNCGAYMPQLPKGE